MAALQLRTARASPSTRAKEAVLAAREALRGVEQQVLLRAVRAYFNVLRATEFVRLAENSARVIARGTAGHARPLRGGRGHPDRHRAGRGAARGGALHRSPRRWATWPRAREEYKRRRRPLSRAARPRAARRPRSPRRSRRPRRSRGDGILRSSSSSGSPGRRDRHPARRTREMGPSLSATAGADLGRVPSTRATTVIGAELPRPDLPGRGAVLRPPPGARPPRRRARRRCTRPCARSSSTSATPGRCCGVTDASIEARRREVEASDVALRGTTEESRLGARTTLDVLTAEQDLLDARANLVSTQIDGNIAVYALWAVDGDPVGAGDEPRHRHLRSGRLLQRGQERARAQCQPPGAEARQRLASGFCADNQPLCAGAGWRYHALGRRQQETDRMSEAARRRNPSRSGWTRHGDSPGAGRAAAADRRRRSIRCGSIPGDGPLPRCRQGGVAGHGCRDRARGAALGPRAPHDHARSAGWCATRSRGVFAPKR